MVVHVYCKSKLLRLLLLSSQALVLKVLTCSCQSSGLGRAEFVSWSGQISNSSKYKTL